jgi:hypothetical protein
LYGPPPVPQVDAIGARRIVAGAVQGVNQVCQTLIENGLRNAFIAAAPERNRRMITKSQNRVACISQEQIRILRFHVIVLGGCPEIIPDQLTIFVSQIVKNLLRILPNPVVDTQLPPLQAILTPSRARNEQIVDVSHEGMRQIPHGWIASLVPGGEGFSGGQKDR